ncbi:MAG: hypothetical protein KC636_34895, partial [Myxococcales bacterium]|nr:hypothetical protein [Myxococcales bacterium]
HDRSGTLEIIDRRRTKLSIGDGRNHRSATGEIVDQARAITGQRCAHRSLRDLLTLRIAPLSAASPASTRVAVMRAEGMPR